MLYFDKKLNHPLIELLKKNYTYTNISIIDNVVPDINSGYIFVNYNKNLSFNHNNKIVLCFKNDSSIDFSEYLEKIWWDFLEDPYYVSVLNLDESFKFLKTDFNLIIDYKELKSVNTFKKRLLISNAYSYCLCADSEYILYSVITSSKYRKKVFNFFEKNILNVEENSFYKVNLIDDYTFEISNIPYLGNLENSVSEQLDTLISILLRFKDFSRIDLGDQEVYNTDLDEHLFKIFKYIAANKIYPEDFLTVIKNFYEKNKDSIIKLQSFSQNNCSTQRLVSKNSIIAFDYFSLYNVKKHYTSFVVDLAQIIVSILQNNPSISLFKKMTMVSHIINLVPREYRIYVFFFSLLDRSSIFDQNVSALLSNLFKKELLNI